MLLVHKFHEHKVHELLFIHIHSHSFTKFATATALFMNTHEFMNCSFMFIHNIRDRRHTLHEHPRVRELFMNCS